MAYDYSEERPKLFTMINQHRLIRLRDKAIRMFALAGALDVLVLKQGADMPSSSWEQQGLIDYMVELGLLVPITVSPTGGDFESTAQFYQPGSELVVDVLEARKA